MPIAEEADVDVAATPVPEKEVEKIKMRNEAEKAPEFEEAREPEDKAPPGVSKSFEEMARKLENTLKPPAKKEPEKKAEPEHAKQPKSDTKQEAVYTSPKAAQWKEIKEAREKAEAEANEWKTKHAALEKALNEAKTKAIDLTPYENKVKEAEKAREEAITKLEQLALERSDRFSSHYQKLFQDAISRAREAAGSDQAEKIEELMHLPAKSKERKRLLEEAVAGLPEMDKGNLVLAIAEFDRARADRDEKLADSKTNFQRLQEAEARQKQLEAESKKAQVEQAVQAVMGMAGEYEAFKVKDGDEAHNRLAEANRKRLERFLKAELPDSEIRTMPIMAAEGERATKIVIPALQKEIMELKTALAEYQKADVNISEGVRGQKESSEPVPESGFPGGGDFIKKFKQHWSK